MHDCANRQTNKKPNSSAESTQMLSADGCCGTVMTVMLDICSSDVICLSVVSVLSICDFSNFIPTFCCDKTLAFYHWRECVSVLGAMTHSSHIRNFYFFIFVFALCRKWIKVETLSMVQHPVHDIQFAPNVGRSYHLLAIASKELYIFTLKPYR